MLLMRKALTLWPLLGFALIFSFHAVAFNLPKRFPSLTSVIPQWESLGTAIGAVELSQSSKYLCKPMETIKIYPESVDFEEPDDTDSLVGTKQPLLFLPGLDGVGNYSTGSVRKLNVFFDVWKMSISGEDRSTFLEVAATVINHLDTFDKPAILVGESFGGLLASYVAYRAPQKVDKLVLVNPASSFDTGPAFPVVGLATLMSTAVDFAQFRRVGKSIMERINSTDTAVSTMNEMLDAAKAITELLPPETLEWRVQKWFGDGTFIMKDRYKSIKTPTLILSGRNDRLLPSRDEGRRLLKEMKTTERIQLKEFNCGHALLDGTTIDFGEEIMSSTIFSPKKSPLDTPFPTEADLAEVDQQFGPILRALSPVFLSKGEDGFLRRGLGPVPTGHQGRPVLLVGNHQLMGADLGPLVLEFIREKQVLIRGLAHPMIFAQRSPQGGGAGDFMNRMVKFGAVEVSPINYFELLKRNETVLLFPGGAREALHNKGEEYKLFWPEKVDFVRMAGMLDAIIVPFAAVGVADSLDIVLDGEDLLRIPFLSDRIKKGMSSIPSARAGVNESYIPPLLAPRAPERTYFLFQQPIDTRDLDIYNKQQCRVLYDHVRHQVEDGIVSLLRFRESDPYKEFLPRTLYEAFTGGQQAPTAPLNLKW